MKTLKGHIAVGLLVVLLVSQLTIPARARNQSPADRIRASGLFYYFVGRLLLNPSNGTVTVVGYFTDLEGIAGPLFDGAPSEATAYFTFRSDVFSSQSLPTNIDMAISLGNPGTYTIYFNPVPSGNWSNLDSFSSGQVVATSQRTTVNILSVGPVSTQIFSFILASSSDFTFNGKTYNLNRIVPNGLTNYHLASNTVVTSGVADFPLALAFGGGGKQAVRPGAAGEVAGLLGQREAC